MKHLTGILVYDKDIPDSHLQALESNFSNKIEIQIESKKENFISKINDYNIFIINSQFLKILDSNLFKIIVVNKNLNYCVENQLTTVIFDPFRNEDRTKKNYKTTVNTFLKTVEYSLELFNIPTTPDDSVQTIIELD